MSTSCFTAIGAGVAMSLIFAVRERNLPAVTCSPDEVNLAGQLYLKADKFKALPVTKEAKSEKMIQFARSAKGEGEQGSAPGIQNLALSSNGSAH